MTVDFPTCQVQHLLKCVKMCHSKQCPLSMMMCVLGTTKLWGLAAVLADRAVIQRDLNSPPKWGSTNLLVFSQGICKVLPLDRLTASNRAVWACG